MLQQSLCAVMVVWWNISNELHGWMWNNLRDWDLVVKKKKLKKKPCDSLNVDVCMHWTVKCYCDVILNVPVHKHLTVKVQ